jgi:hypothetical protein
MKRSNGIAQAARILGKRGGTKTLKTHGAEKMREWGKLGAKFGKLGGRPRKPLSQLSETGKYQRRRRERQRSGER